jgi:2-polyprenyl-3-methyl-5-hydroxy-6-metoxy-1,4-benzoquinol methylase
VCNPNTVEFDGSDISGKFDLIVCNYVVNVVDNATYKSILELLMSHINKGGIVAISSAGKGMVQMTENKVALGENTVLTSRGTTQTYRSSELIFNDLQAINPNITKLGVKLGGMVSTVIKVN